MWKPTAQENLWFHGGNLMRSRLYSIFLGLQLKARLEGLPTPVLMAARRSITKRDFRGDIRGRKRRRLRTHASFLTPLGPGSEPPARRFRLLPQSGEPDVPKTDFRADPELGRVKCRRSRPSAVAGSRRSTGPRPRCWSIASTWRAWSGPVTMAYLHGPAPVGQNAQQVAPINVPFYADRSTISDGVTLTKQQADEVWPASGTSVAMTEKYPEARSAGRSCRSRSRAPEDARPCRRRRPVCDGWRERHWPRAWPRLRRGGHEGDACRYRVGCC